MTAGNPDGARPSLRTAADDAVRVNQRSVICRPLTSHVVTSIDPTFTFDVQQLIYK